MTRHDIHLAFFRIPPSFILSLPFVVFILFTRLTFDPITDEYLFHLKAIEAFASSFPVIPLKDYPSGSGPLPYVIWVIIGKIFGFDLWKLRLLTAFASYLAILLFLKLCREQDISSPLLRASILVFFPYIFLHSFTLYTINIALFWEVFSLLFFLRYAKTDSTTDLLWGALGSLALVFCRQIDVALPLGALCFLLFEKRLKRPLTLFLGIAPLLGLLLLVIYWKGITPPRFQTVLSPHLKLTHFTLFLTLIGFYFQPIGLLEGWRLKGWTVLFCLLLIPYFLIFPIPYPEEGLGIVYYGIDSIGRKFHAQMGQVLPLYFGAVGGLVLYGIGKGIWRLGRFSLPAFVLLFYLFFGSLNPFVYERHYYFTWPLLLLLLPRDVSESRFLSLSVLAIHMAVSILYVGLLLVWTK